MWIFLKPNSNFMYAYMYVVFSVSSISTTAIIQFVREINHKI